MLARKVILVFVLSLSTVVAAAEGPIRASLAGTVPTRHVLTLEVGGQTTAMEIYGFHHKVDSPRDAATGLPTGKRRHHPFSLTKPAQENTPLFLSQLLQGGVLDSVRIESFRQSGRNAPMERYAVIDMKRVLVSSHSMEQEEDPTRRRQGHEVRERVELVYEAISWSWPDGTQLSDTWQEDEEK